MRSGARRRKGKRGGHRTLGAPPWLDLSFAAASLMAAVIEVVR